MKRLLVTGASGQLGSYVLRELRDHVADVVAWSGTRRGELFGHTLHAIDLTNTDVLAEAFAQARPDTVIHAAALARIADCHRDPTRAHRVNTVATATLAELAARSGTRFVLVSTDLVFDGEHAPYREQDPPAPVSVYGRSKAAAEQAALAFPRAAVSRVSLLYGPALVGRPSFFDEQIAALRGGRPVTFFVDEWRTPLDLPTAAKALLSLADSDYTGVLHIGGPERMSRLEMGRRLAAVLVVSDERIVTARRDEVPSAEPRPRDVSLDSSKWRQLFPANPWPPWEEALREMSLFCVP
jgi:dTDP-4-dehydrorhamnose reductase